MTLDEVWAQLLILHDKVDQMAAKLKQPPSITVLSATPASLPAGGGSVTLNATVKNATSVTLDGVAVTLPVTRQVTSSHTFTLNAHGQKLPDAVATVPVSVAAPAVRAFGFDSAADLGPNLGDGPPGYTAANSHGYNTLSDGISPLVNNGALEFVIQPKAGNINGSWITRFSDDDSVTYGPNSEFHVRFKYWHDGVLTDPLANEGVKLCFFSANGDVASGSISNDQPLLVTQTYYTSGYLNMYAYAGWPGPGLYQLMKVYPPAPDCLLPANEWLTLDFHIKYGNIKTEAPYAGLAIDAEVTLDITRADGSVHRAIDYGPTKPNYEGKYYGLPWDGANVQRVGKVRLLPYITGKDAAVDHPVYRVRYDDLSVSGTAPVPAPIPAPLPDPAPTPTPTPGAMPAWRAGKPIGQWFSIPGSSIQACPGTFEGMINAWNGMGRLKTRWYGALQGGHGESTNMVVCIDLAQDAPKFAMIDPRSATADITTTRYNLDGRPESRHTYYTTQCIEAAHSSDGKERIVLPNCSAAYALGFGYGNAPDVESFDIAGKTWEKGWPTCPVVYLIPAVCRDPRNSDIYVQSGGDGIDGREMAVLRAKTGQWDHFQSTPVYPSPDRQLGWLNKGSVVDGKRDRIVCLHDGGPYSDGRPRLQLMNLTTRVCSNLFVTGMPNHEPYRNALTHDLDNDRYIYPRWIADPTAPDPHFTGTVEVWSIDPDTGAATHISNTVAPSVTTEDRFAYFPELGGYAWLARYDGDIWFCPTR